jgi:hypothetical protein
LVGSLNFDVAGEDGRFEKTLCSKRRDQPGYLLRPRHTHEMFYDPRNGSVERGNYGREVLSQSRTREAELCHVLLNDNVSPTEDNLRSQTAHLSSQQSESMTQVRACLSTLHLELVRNLPNFECEPVRERALEEPNGLAKKASKNDEIFGTLNVVGTEARCERSEALAEGREVLSRRRMVNARCHRLSDTKAHSKDLGSCNGISCFSRRASDFVALELLKEGGESRRSGGVEVTSSF